MTRDLAAEALYWLAASMTATILWARTGIGVFLAAAYGFTIMVWVWMAALGLVLRAAV